MTRRLLELLQILEASVAKIIMVDFMFQKAMIVQYFSSPTLTYSRQSPHLRASRSKRLWLKCVIKTNECYQETMNGSWKWLKRRLNLCHAVCKCIMSGLHNPPGRASLSRLYLNRICSVVRISDLCSPTQTRPSARKMSQDSPPWARLPRLPPHPFRDWVEAC